MGTRRAPWLISTAAIIGLAMPVIAQQAGPSPGRSAIKSKASATRSAPARGIGRTGGSLLPQSESPNAARSPHAPGGQSQLGVPGTARPDPTAARGLSAAAPAIMRRPSTTDPAVQGDSNTKDSTVNRPGIGVVERGRALHRRVQDERPCAPGRAGFIAPRHGDPRSFSADRRSVVDPRALVTPPQSADPLVSGAIAPAGSAAGAPATGEAGSGAGPSDFERAGNQLYDGKPDEAVVILRSYTQSHPGDTEAVRALALALIDARRTGEGVELMGQVYATNPALASAALPADAVGPERELRDLVVRVVQHAHKVNTPAAWLTAAALMQGEGRTEPALKMIENAAAAGLRADVVTAMRSALKS